MKLLFKFRRVSEFNSGEEIDIDLTKEQYNKYLEKGELPGKVSEDLLRSLMKISGDGFNLKHTL